MSMPVEPRRAPRRSLAFAVVAAALCWCGGAAAQGVPVIDAAAVAEAANTLKAASQQVQQLNAMLTEVQGIAQAIGKEGVPTLLFQEALSQSGISQFGPPVKEVFDSVQGVVTDAEKLKGQIDTLGKKPDFSSFTSAESWVKSELTTARDANLTLVSTTGKLRKLLAGEAAAHAYALALSGRQQVAGMSTRAQQLSQQAASAADLRGDVAANTAVMLAMHDQLAQIQALMAAVLEVQSASRLADADPRLASGEGAGSAGDTTAGSAAAGQ